MPYYIGDVIEKEERLIARTPEEFRKSGIEVMTEAAVEEIDAAAGRVSLADGSRLAYDLLVLGTGTRPLLPGIPGQELKGVFTLKSLADARAIKEWLSQKRCRRAVIVGAGFIGLEMSEALRVRGIETVVIHNGRLPANRWDPELGKVILEEMERHGVVFVPEATTRAIEESGGRLRLVTDKGEEEADMVLLAVGVRPEVKLARQMGLELGQSGAVKVNFSQQTSRPEVYAVGDCAESFHRVSGRWVNVPLGDIANKQGRVAGRNIAGGSAVFPGIVGAQAFKIFGLEAAAAGLDEREAAAAGFHPLAVVVWGNAIAASMPGSTRLGLKLLADRATGRLLGAQAVGAAGAVRRINILSTALWAGLTVEDASWLDLAYAPPVAGAWDPIHIAAQKLRQEI